MSASSSSARSLSIYGLKFYSIHVECTSTGPDMDAVSSFVSCKLELLKRGAIQPRNVFISESPVDFATADGALNAIADFIEEHPNDWLKEMKNVKPGFSKNRAKTLNGPCYVDAPFVGTLRCASHVYVPLRAGLDMKLANCTVDTWSWLEFAAGVKSKVTYSGYTFKKENIPISTPQTEYLFVDCKMEDGTPYPPVEAEKEESTAKKAKK